jgi:hypothetical protein
MIPILIRKDPNRCENLAYNKEDFQSVIDEVDLSDILDYIISTINNKWAPNCYWKFSSIDDTIYSGELQWIIYSYLVHKGLLMVEDQYFGYNTSRTEKYKDRCSYHNTLVNDLYNPIGNRMVSEKYITDVDYRILISQGGPNINYRYYKLGPVYWRNHNLEKIGI